MAFRTQLLLILAALFLLAAGAALAAPASAASALPVAPAATLTLAAPFCPAAGSLPGLGEPRAAALEVCGACSDAICVGQDPGSVCGDGFRCLVSGMCGAAAVPHCKCLNI